VMKSWSATRSKGRKLDFVERPVKPVDYGRTQRPKELWRMALGLALAHPRAMTTPCKRNVLWAAIGLLDEGQVMLCRQELRGVR
jgi:hypothetical protein